MMAVAIGLVSRLPTNAQVPAILNFQGYIAVGDIGFNGNGQFKFALVNGDASQTYWRNTADGDANGEPDLPVAVNLSKGRYSVYLGDTNLANMAPLPSSALSNGSVYLRIWFNDGVNGFQLLSPDQRISSVAYSMIAGTVPDGAIGQAKLGADVTATLNDLKTRLEQVESSTSTGLTVVSTESSDTDLISKGFQAFSSIDAKPWTMGTSDGVPTSRYGHSTVWTGSEMLVWGGYFGNGLYSNTGGAYQAAQNSWDTLSSFNAATARQSHSAVWTGTEMIVWGGFGTQGFLNTGSRYHRSQQAWTGVTTTAAPTARSHHVGVWTGTKMIVWGGRGFTGYLSDGGVYDPSNGQWSALNLGGEPAARHSATAIWSGSQMLVWGGQGGSGALNSGSRLSFDGNGAPSQWNAITTTAAPSGRYGHTSVWTGSQLIVWGGRSGSSFYNNGGIYDPAADTWTGVSKTDAPSSRSGHVAVWTGSEMVIYGGEDSSGALATGGAYDPASNTWRSLNTAGSPTARVEAGAAWTGSELLVFGGRQGANPLSSLERLNPQPTWHLYRKP